MTLRLINSVLILLLSSSAYSQTILLDDFSDPSLTGWFQTETYSEKDWGPGTVEVRDGELFFGTDGAIPLGSESGLNNTGFALTQWNASATDPTFTDGTLRAKVRAEAPDGSTEAGNIAMFVRGDLSTLTAYVLGAVGTNKAFVIDKFVNGAVAEEWQIEGVELTLNEDWFMELGAIGETVSAKVWKATDPEPATPQLNIVDSDIPLGTIGLTAAMSPGSATEAFALNTYYDDVTFTVPEPQLGLISVLLCLAVCRYSAARPRTGRLASHDG